MKRWTTIVLLLLAGALVMVLSSCSLLSLTITQRIQALEADLNKTDRMNAYLNMHPDSYGFGATAGSGTTWDFKFPTTDIPFSVTGIPADPVGPIVDCTISGTAFGPYPIRFEMRLYGESDWRIWDIQLDEGGGFASIF